MEALIRYGDEEVVAWLPDGKSIVFATQVIPELAGSFAKTDLAAMKKEAKRRKDSKMTGQGAIANSR